MLTLLSNSPFCDLEKTCFRPITLCAFDVVVRTTPTIKGFDCVSSW
jgi:hypothetical protein